jgi:hypothetical protein
MERSIGRLLREGEVVHHINRNPMDNRIENLQILTKKEHDRISVLVAEKCMHLGCDREHKARGLCGTHYNRYRRAGIAFPLPASRKNGRMRKAA